MFQNATVDILESGVFVVGLISKKIKNRALGHLMVVRRSGALALVMAGLVGLSGCGREEPWNVIILTLDTTRADHIGCYGKAEASTPNIDAVAASGVRFENAFASVPITLPSHTTLMTGLYPLAHGIRDNGIFVVDDHHTTLAERLSDIGYRTAAGIGSFPLGTDFNLDQGFELYDDRFNAQYEDFRGRRVMPKTGIFFDERPAVQVNEAVMPWLEEHHDQPFLLWLHYFDPHQPLEPPAPYDQLFLDDPYLGEIAYADEAFGAVMSRLESLGVADRTIIVIAADHGEGRGDHGEDTHSMLAYGSTLHVPLIIKVPGGLQGQVVSERVGLVDVAPTIVDLLGMDVDPVFQGRSLVPELEGRNRPPVAQYAETLSPRLSHGLGELRVLFDGEDKYIHGPRPELFNLASDPKELNNLIEFEPALAEAMMGRLEEFMAAHAADDPQQVGSVDDEARMRLEALGYLTSTVGPAEPIREVLQSDGLAPQDRVGDVNLMSRAKHFLFEKDGVAAREAAAELLRRQPEDPMALEMLASASLLLGHVDRALGYVQQLRDLHPEGTQLSARLMLQLGTLHLYRGDIDTARELLGAAQNLEPSAEGQYLVALTYLTAGDAEAELKALEASLELDPGYAPSRVALGVSAARRGDSEAAEAAFRRALLDHPYFARAHFNYGAFLTEQDRLEDALEYFERAVELAPDYPQALMALVAVTADLDRPLDARKWYEELQKKAPDSGEAQRAADFVEAE